MTGDREEQAHGPVRERSGCQAASAVGYACVLGAGHGSKHRDEAGNEWPLSHLVEVDRWAARVKLLEQRADLARRVLAGQSIQWHPLVLQAAADAVQLQALATEGEALRHRNSEKYDHATLKWLDNTARELRRIERELREEGGKS